MRIRLQLLLPVVVGLVVGAGFILAATTIGDPIAAALTRLPPSHTDAEGARVAAAAARRMIAVWGILAVAGGVVVSAVVARMIVVPLGRMREAAQRLAEPDGGPEHESSVAEIQDVARGMSRAAGELRDRHGRELRERSELASLVEAVSEGILQLDSGGRVVRCNEAGRRLLGLPADAAGRSVASLVRHPGLRRLLARGSRGDATETAEVVLDEQRILVSASPQPDGGAVATFVDLTDLRRLEEIRRDFVANASHELKTPLTSIRGYTETLMGAELPPAEQRQFLETIARNAGRLQRIVDDLLDLSRVESGRWQPDLQTLDVLDLAESCWLAFADRAGNQGVAFDATGREGQRLGIVDRRGLEQVFANLYDNALRYTPEHGRIRVTTTVTAEPPDRNGAAGAAGSANGNDGAQSGPWLLVEVSDTGSGIPRDALPRIFERFYRVDPARSRAEGGTGLGLSIVKHMMESMGGAVTARSELGKGTTIRLWLPRPS